MFTIDDRLRGLPATREQVIGLHQSINQPHLAIPSKQAGPAQAFIVWLRGSAGFTVFVYLYLPESQDCALYVSDRRNLTPEEYGGEEAEALGFVESMGFILDNLNFRGLPQPQQDELMKTLPVFMRDPRQVPVSAATPGGAKAGDGPKPNSTMLIGRLFSSF